MSTLVTAVFSILLSVAAQFSLKAGMSSDAVRLALAQPYSLRTAVAVFSNGHVLGGFVLYGYIYNADDLLTLAESALPIAHAELLTDTARCPVYYIKLK